MRTERRGTVAALLLGAAGIVGASTYAGWTVPLHRVAAAWAAQSCACRIANVSVVQPGAGSTSALQLTAVVTEGPADSIPVAVVANRVNVGGIVQVPIVLLGLLLAWPAHARRDCAVRGALALLALPLLELLTTGSQLVAPLWALGAEMQLRSVHGWMTGWTQFIESGGRIAVTAAIALLIISGSGSAAARLRLHRAGRRAPVARF